MSAESVRENAIRKVIQELIVPDLQKLIGKVDILEEKINSTNTRIDALDEKIESTKNELKADIGRLNDKIDTKITALDEKIDLMNRFNERLFNLIHPTGQK